MIYFRFDRSDLSPQLDFLSLCFDLAGSLHSLPAASILLPRTRPEHAHTASDWLPERNLASLMVTPAVRHFVLSRVMSSQKCCCFTTTL